MSETECMQLKGVDGISHSPKEFTKTVDITNGANVLLQTILKVDQQF
jgi:beta-ureidopropionase / N-carbamoyl-L-amino-acid hydrolase